MGSSEEFLHAKFDKWLTLGQKPVHLKGNFLFCPPYDWDENVNWDLIHTLEKTLTDWVLRWIPADQITPGSVKSSAIFAFHSCPSSWRQKTAVDSKTYAKLVAYSKMTHFMFEVDDTTEQESGKESHCKYVQHVGRLVLKILLYQLQSVTDIKHDELYPFISQTSSYAATCMELLLDFAEDLKINFGVTKDSSHHYAYLIGQGFAMQSWCGEKDQSNLLNPYTQYHLRWYTGGMACLIQLSFLLEGIHIPPAVRENFYWIRCFHVAGFLTLRTNDIIGLEKEFLKERKQGLRADNVVFHFMDSTNCTFEQAVFRGIAEHNMALKEFHDFLKFVTTNSHILFDLNDEELKIFTKTTKIMAECVAYTTQGQILMSRYNAGLKLTFQKFKTIYGLQPNDWIKETKP